jgi:hypothetical protein
VNGLKALVVTALATATVGAGGLATAPSASAENNCDYYENKSIAYDNTATILYSPGNYYLGNRYRAMSQAYEGAWEHCMGYL